MLAFASSLFAQDDAGSMPLEPVKDYFSFTGEVHVPATGARDVIAAGPVVVIDNPVRHDVIAAGGTVTVQSDVAGDVRLAGSRVVIDANIGGNVAIMAQTVEIMPGSSISGSVRIHAQEVIMDGAINGDADITARTFTQNGAIGGDLKHTQISTSVQKSPMAWFFRIVGLFGMLVVGLVLVNIVPTSLRTAVHESIKNPTKDLLWGLVALIAVPVVAVVLMFTVIGLPLGILLGVGYVVALYLAKILVGIVLGTYLFGAIRGREQAQKASLLGSMALGVCVLWLITGIPWIGGLLAFVAVVWGLGMLVNFKVRVFKKFES
ncbi:hypothetical protein BK004_02400 [bacterium CG10_46_32]|nr:MAG: hypothetical protein BK004_02400 [bacterium CG10_46_32]